MCSAPIFVEVLVENLNVAAGINIWESKVANMSLRYCRSQVCLLGGGFWRARFVLEPWNLSWAVHRDDLPVETSRFQSLKDLIGDRTTTQLAECPSHQAFFWSPKTYENSHYLMSMSFSAILFLFVQRNVKKREDFSGRTQNPPRLATLVFFCGLLVSIFIASWRRCRWIHQKCIVSFSSPVSRNDPTKRFNVKPGFDVFNRLTWVCPWHGFSQVWGHNGHPLWGKLT